MIKTTLLVFLFSFKMVSSQMLFKEKQILLSEITKGGNTYKIINGNYKYIINDSYSVGKTMVTLYFNGEYLEKAEFFDANSKIPLMRFFNAYEECQKLQKNIILDDDYKMIEGIVSKYYKGKAKYVYSLSYNDALKSKISLFTIFITD